MPTRDVAAQTFTCELGKTAVRVQGGRTSQTSITSPEDVPSTTLRFTQGPGRPGCVVIQFSAAVNAGKDAEMAIIAVLDSESGGVRTIVGGVRFAFDDDESLKRDAARARTFNFAARGIEPGDYTARIQWSSVRGGGVVYMQERTVIVQHQ